MPQPAAYRSLPRLLVSQHAACPHQAVRRKPSLRPSLRPVDARRGRRVRHHSAQMLMRLQR